MINVDERILDLANENELFLMVQIGRHMDKNKLAFPSNNTLCTLTKWDIKKVQRVKKSCVKKGFFSIEERKRKNDGGQSSNGYKFKPQTLTKYTRAPIPQNGIGGISQNRIGGHTPKWDTQLSIDKKEVLISLKTLIGGSQFDLISQLEIDLSEKKFSALIEFLEYRKETKKQYKAKSSIKKLIKVFEDHSEEKVIEAVNEAIQKGWQGLVFDKGRFNLPKSKTKPNGNKISEARKNGAYSGPVVQKF